MNVTLTPVRMVGLAKRMTTTMMALYAPVPAHSQDDSAPQARVYNLCTKLICAGIFISA